MTAPALGAGTALAAMLFAARLPVTLDFILPRRAGWPLFALAHDALSRPGPRSAFTWSVSLLLAASFARAAWLLVASARKRKWSGRGFMIRGFAAAVVVLLTRWSFAIWLEVSQKVWFPFGALNPLEPFANLLACSAIAFAAMACALACVSARPVRALVVWGGANALAAILAYSAYGAWRDAPPPDAGRLLFVVLTEEDGRPGRAAYDLPVAEAPATPLAGVSRLETLRALYETRAKLMDPKGLRSALMLGVKHNDDLARSLLLAHLSAAPPSPEALGALGALADETAHRIGAVGASRIALAYAHLGDAAQAAVWAKRAEAAPRGIPAGLLDLSGGGALKPGRIAGRLEGVRPLRVGLYLKPDPGAPYLLDAAALVASTVPDAKGAFTFNGLAAGRYYLAFAFSPQDRELRVHGHRGDLTLDARRRYIELPSLRTDLGVN